MALAILLISCERNEEQAIRHIVTAELIERYQVSEEHVRLVEIQLEGTDATVRAEVREHGRAGAKRELICKVKRTASPASAEAHWIVTTIEDGHAGSAAPKER